MKCPKCGKEMSKERKYMGFDQQMQPTWFCFKMFGGCGHEEKVK